MITRVIGNSIRVIAEKPHTGLKVGDYICKDITLLGIDIDTSQIKEINLEVIANGESE